MTTSHFLLSHVPVPGDWAEHAACRGHNTEDFFPHRGVPVADHVRAVCRSCAVRLDCLDFGIRWPVLGIWGGVATRERRRLRVQRKAAA